ncbi:MAG TPA: metallophosphoesterase [Puia sp.]|nr:metallophosphoesterase [Puia sp.]
MMSIFVMGDIHGAARALEQCLERSGFDRRTDTLIQLGDVVDGFDEVYETVEQLLDIDNLIAIKGNHDDWFFEFIQSGYHPAQWSWGAISTARSYLRKIGKEKLVKPVGSGFKVALNPADIPERHQAFFRRQHLYYIDDNNRCFVHGGFNRHQPFRGQRPELYYWDRDLWVEALNWLAEKIIHHETSPFEMATDFDAIFIGHTSTLKWKTTVPMRAANIYNLDTGAGHHGRLTIMNVETKKFWQSDPVNEIYGKSPARISMTDAAL